MGTGKAPTPTGTLQVFFPGSTMTAQSRYVIVWLIYYLYVVIKKKKKTKQNRKETSSGVMTTAAIIAMFSWGCWGPRDFTDGKVPSPLILSFPFL